MCIGNKMKFDIYYFFRYLYFLLTSIKLYECLYVSFKSKFKNLTSNSQAVFYKLRGILCWNVSYYKDLLLVFNMAGYFGLKSLNLKNYFWGKINTKINFATQKFQANF